MSVQDATLQLFLDGAWTEVPLFATPVTVERGTEPYSDSWPSPSRFEADIDNDDLNYDPANPEAAIYGVAGRNTLARLEVNGTTGLTAEVAEWSPERDPAHYLGGGRGRSSTGVTAEGVQRRISRWTDQLKSPMYAVNAARSTSLGHWPLEDGRQATQLSNTLQGGRPATISGEYTLGDSEAPLGAASSLRMSLTHAIDGTFAAASTTAGWQFTFSFRLAALPTTGTFRNLIFWQTTTGYNWVIQVNNTSYQLLVIDADGAFPVADATTFGANRDPNQWITMRVKASQSGGTVTGEVAWYAHGVPGSVGFTSTFTGTIGALLTWSSNGNAWLDGGWLSHVLGVTGGTDNLDNADAQLVSTGYLGELTTTRFLRLCALRNITAYLNGGEADGTPMGPQRPNTFVNLLDETRRTEDGRIDDVRSEIALAMRTRRHLYAQDPSLELVFPGDISPPFRRIIDDQATANHVTASNADGGEVVTSLDVGPMSTQPSPDGVGEYRKTVEVSVSDETSDLANIANWHLAKGTIEKPRYSTLVVNLIANPTLATACAAVGLGDLITVDGFEPDLLRLLVTKVCTRVQTGVWRFEFGVELYEPYNAGRWDTFRWDAQTSTLAEALTRTETIWDIQCEDIRDAWSTTSLPYDVVVGGEVCQMYEMSAPTGTGPFLQTGRTVRSVNGVFKTHAIGAEIHLADAKRWGL